MEVLIRTLTPDRAATWEAMRRQLWPGSEHHGQELLLSSKARYPTWQSFRLTISAERRSVLPKRLFGWRLQVSNRSQPGYAEGLYVIPARRNEAVARKLLPAARKWARHQGCVAFASDCADRVIVDASF